MTEHSDRVDEFFDALQKAVFTPSTSSSDDYLYPSDVDLAEGEAIEHFKIISPGVSGGMGRVYRAHDTRLDRDVALKFLPSYLAADAAERERLLKEARAAAALDHPNVCSIHEIGETEDGRLFIAMPWYDGETLKQRLRRGPIAVDTALSIPRQITAGLCAAHNRGVIHRDVKPGNVIILADAGIVLPSAPPPEMIPVDRGQVDSIINTPTISDHVRMQWKLARLGLKAGERVWVPVGDQSRLRQTYQFDSFDEEFSAGIDLPHSYIENIDVVWKQEFRIGAAYEIENSTSIYSGLLRFADLNIIAPNTL